MTHNTAPAIATEPVSVPNQPFFAWLRTQTALFVGQLLALIGAFGSIVGLAYYVGGLHVPPSFLTPSAISTFVIYSHLGFLTIFIIWLIKGLDDKRGVYRAHRVHDRLIEVNFAASSLTVKGQEKLDDIATQQVGKFKRWFLLFWCAMLFLYIVFTVEIKYGVFFHPDPSELYVKGEVLIFPFVTFLANNVSMFFIFGCFVALYLPAGRNSARNPSEVPALTDQRIMDEAAEHRRRQAKLLWWFGMLLALFTMAYPVIYWLRPLKLTIDNWGDYPAIFNALSGTLNAVVVALLIARLDSKLIGLPPWLISILYFYSGIQPMFVVFEQQLDEFDAIRAVVLVVVFIFKLYFFLIIFYSLQNGRLLNYFYCSPLLNQHVSTKQNESKAPHLPSKTTNVDVVAPPPSSERVAFRNKFRSLLDHWPTRTFMSFGSRLLNHPLHLAGKKKARNLIEKLRGKIESFRLTWQAERLLMVSKLLGWLAITYLVISLLYYAKIFCSRTNWPTLCPHEPFLFSPDLKLLIIYAHLPLLLIIIASLIRVRRQIAASDTNRKPNTEPQNSALPTAKSRLQQFQRFFLIFWYVMLMFYVAYAIKQYIDPSTTSPQEHGMEVSAGSSSHHGVDTREESISVLCSEDERVEQRLDHQLHEGWTPLAIASGRHALRTQKLWGESKDELSAPVAVSSNVPCSSLIIEAHSRSTDKNIEFARNLMAERDLDQPFILLQPPAIDENTKTHAREQLAWVVGYSVITFLLNNLMVLFIFLCFSVLYLSIEERHGDTKYKSLRNYAILICFLITITTPLPLFSLDKNTMGLANPAVATTVIAAVGGVLNAVAFALLFARLDSRLIRLPTAVISILYVYAALQPLFVVFERGTPVFSAIETSALLAAFLFKICFVLVIFQALRSGSIEYHLKNFPSLNTRVNSIFDNQYEIRVHKTEKQFKYSIFKRDVQIFRGEEPYPTREACNTAVMDLLKLMGNKANYKTAGPVHGTYWLQILEHTEDGTKTEKTLCESKDLSSNDEVEDLIAECVEKVPYCKYSRV